MKTATATAPTVAVARNITTTTRKTHNIDKNKMSLEFVRVHAPIHHQCFQMVGMLIHHFGWNMKRLNPFAKPCEPTTEVREVNVNEEAQQKDARCKMQEKV